MKARPRLWALALVGIVATTACRRRPKPPVDAEAAQVRERVIAIVAPAPVPTALPLVGPDGKDADGYPTRTVDRAAMRALLGARRFDDLTRYTEELQHAFEADPRKETWVSDAGDAFDSAEPEIVPLLDAWVAASPGSFAPYLARGTHWVDVGYARRGPRWADDTPEEAFAAMRDAFGHATHDLDKALTLRPKLVAARRKQLLVAAALSDPALGRAAIDAAVATCPSCFQVRAVYLTNLEPRWGGSYEAMDRYAEESAAADPSNPRLRLLAGLADLDRAAYARQTKRFDDASAILARVAPLGDYWEFSVDRAELEMKRGERPAALADAERAVALRPGHPRTLATRAWAYYEMRRHEDAARDVVAVVRMCPTDGEVRELAPKLAARLLADARAAASAGQREDAVRLVELAAEIAPRIEGLDRARAEARNAPAAPARAPAPPPGPPSPAVAAAEAAAKAAPDDVETLRRLDDALARENRYDRVVEVWTDFLARHPGSGRAYLERGGAYTHLRRGAEARADIVKACDLGEAEACALAKRFGGGR